MKLFEEKEMYNINDLLQIVSLLRDEENGCPWDIAQTHESIRQNFIEETYEAVEAIDLSDMALLQEELGDVLLQVVLHAQIETEADAFTFSDVCDGICKKLIQRHPHIFGGAKADTTQEVLKNWESIKKQEKKQETIKDTLLAVPSTFPALMRAQKVQKRVSKASEIKNDKMYIFPVLQQKIEELEKLESIEEDVCTTQTEEIGEILFHITNLAHILNIDAEEALALYTKRYIAQFPESDE